MLETWRELRIEVSKLIKGFPPDEKYGLVSQMRRASRSVTNNIAEGFGRYHYQEFIRFCRIGRGSLTELNDHLIVALDEGYIKVEIVDGLHAQIERTIAVINGLLNYLEKKQHRPSAGRVEEPQAQYGLQLLVGPETDQLIN